MAEKGIVDSRQHFPSDASRQQSLKGILGSDNTVPLSPQWLQTKSGNNKEHASMCHGEHVDSVKGSASGEDFHERGKRKDASELALHDTETGSRNRWHDEERETNSAFRRDQKGERWSENSQRFSGESRRIPSERLSDLGNRDGTFDQRRESKWNTRWGPVDKDSDSWREKWPESCRDGEAPREKMSHLTSLGRDIDKEGEQHSRSWRSNSFTSRGKVESYHQSFTPNKQSHMFGYGRGKGENGAPLSSAGRVRFNSGNATSGALRPYHLGSMSAKFDGVHSGYSPLRYSRMKLLDIYRMTDIRNHKVSLDGIIEVPSLTQSELLEPLALSAPSNEELVILKAIDNGEISSSGVPQVSKESTVRRNAVDPAVPRQLKLGSQEDLQFVGVDYTYDGCEIKKFHDAISQKVDPATRPETPFKKADDLIGEIGMPESQFPRNAAAPWRPLSADNSQWSFPDSRNSSAELVARSSDVSWSHLSNDQENEAIRATVSSSFCKDDSSWQNSESRSNLKRYASEISDREQSENLIISPEASLSSRVEPTFRKFQPYPSPEELSLYYKDPHGLVQGPFSGSDLIGWFEAGFFGINLEVRLAGAPPDAPFLLLGDVIPQLRFKVRAPPGFSAAKQSNILDMSIRETIGSNVISTYPGASEYELSKSGQMSGILASTDAESKFMESHMFTKMSGSAAGNFTEGLHGHAVHGPGYSSSVVGESGNGVNYLLDQKRLEHLRNSLQNSEPFLSGKDPSLTALNMAITADSSDPYLKVMPLIGNPSHVSAQSFQQSDLLSLLHAVQVDKSPSTVSSGESAWSKLLDAQVLNNNVQAGSDIHKNKMDIHHNQHPTSQFGFAGQQQQLQPQNLQSLSHLIDKPTGLLGLVPPERLLASDVAQDPQMLNLLAHHYLLSQPPMQSQVPLPSQLSLLNECLLLKQQLLQQQQKQEQQKQLLLQQHQFLLSQVLSGHQSGQTHFAESSQKMHPAVSEGNVRTDHLQLPQVQEAPINQNIQIGNLHDVHGSIVQTANLQDGEYTNDSSKCEPSLRLPHQMFDHAPHSKTHESNPPAVGDNGASHVSLTLGIADPSSVSDALQKALNSFPATENAIDHQKYAKETSTSLPESREFMPSECSVSPLEISDVSGFVSPVSDQIHDLKISLDDIIDQRHADVSACKDPETIQAKKSAEKKSRKKKNSKSQLAMDLLRGFSSASQLEQSKSKLETIQLEQPKSKLETDDVNCHGLTEVHTNSLKPPHALLTAAVDDLSISSAVKAVDCQQSHHPSYCTNMDGELEKLNKKAENSEGSISESSNLRAWKSAPGVKAKSLKEIQQEEQQQRVKMTSEIERFPPTGQVSLPCAGVIGCFDHKTVKDTSQCAFGTEFTMSSDRNLSSKTRKSQLHDLLAEEVLAETTEADTSLARDNKGQLLPLVSSTAAQLDVAAINDEDFTEAKDARKGRKKGSKAKAARAKAFSPNGSFDLPSFPVTAEKGKFEDHVQHEKELLPAPTGPSLADFVFWKDEQTNSSKAPAWSMDLGKFQKPASLRDIQKEQEQKVSVQQNIPVPSTAKAQSNQGSRRPSSLQVPGSSPSTGSTLAQSSLLASRQLKPKIDDDLFWGPSDQPNQETVKPDFPSLGNSNTCGAKGSPARASPVAITQKSSGYRAGDHSPSATGSMSSSRVKKDDEPGNLSEAMGFRDWCEKELVRLTGLNDTSFLEYCSKQSTTEAEILLKENIGSLDRNHEFIDKFLSYKDFLSPKVIEMAFQARPAPGSRGAGAGLNFNADAEVGKGGKKGKKGKKVSREVLGFNVTSNRMMMGEIQTVDD